MSQIYRLLATRTVFFDVDFTLIYPGSTFNGEGYQRFAAKHNVKVSSSRFSAAVAKASDELNRSEDDIYRPDIFIRYARRVLEEMGGFGSGLLPCAEEIYDEWALCQHFALYDDVQPVLESLHRNGLQVGLISNTHRCLTSFQMHFKLEKFIAGALSSSDHGYMKPHASIFEAALNLVGATPKESVMVGDSLEHDINGARQAGMRAVLLVRSDIPDVEMPVDVPVIRTLRELPAVLKELDISALSSR